jgi:hypothetical protein
MPATTADPASFATSCATRVTRAIGAGTREELDRFPLALLVADRVADEALVPTALRDDVAPLVALRFVLAPRFVLADRPLFDDIDERPEAALRELLDAPAAPADLPRDFVLFARFLLALRDEALLPDVPRDFLALVAIDASPRSS